MSFQKEIAVADDVGEIYGDYHSTFRSRTGQVLAQLFEQDGCLVAHVSFPSGIKPEDVTDAYASALEQYATEQGFNGKLRLIFSV